MSDRINEQEITVKVRVPVGIWCVFFNQVTQKLEIHCEYAECEQDARCLIFGKVELEGDDNTAKKCQPCLTACAEVGKERIAQLPGFGVDDIEFPA